MRVKLLRNIIGSWTDYTDAGLNTRKRKQILLNSLPESLDDPFILCSNLDEAGSKIVLLNRLAKELKDDLMLEFTKAISKDFFLLKVGGIHMQWKE